MWPDPVAWLGTVAWVLDLIYIPTNLILKEKDTMNRLTKVMFRTSVTHMGPTMKNSCKAFLMIAMLVNMLFIQTAQPVAAAGNLVPVQTYYVPFPESQLLQGLQGILPTGPVNPVTTYISLAAVAGNTIIYYDQWENGYDADIANPGNLYSAGNPGGTQIWGDGNTANGAPPGVSTDIINPGTVIVLNNGVNTATPLVIDYDGRDKIAATKNIAMTRVGWAAGTGTILAGAIEVYDTLQWGTLYRAPVGENIPGATDFNIFSYTSLAIMAGAGGATVQIDVNADGLFETTVVLPEGQSHFVNGGVNVGAQVSSNNPVQVDLLTGIRNASSSRDSALLPVSAWSNSYYTPVSTDPMAGTSVWLYNPGTSSISVTYTRRVAGVLTPSTLTVPGGAAGGYLKQDIPVGTGASFSSTQNFYAFSTTDSTSGSALITWDWGFSLIPQSSLTPQVLVGLGIGRDPTSGVSPSENGNPVWVTPIGNGNTPVMVYVDYDSNPATGPLVDPNGNRYNVSYNLRELDQQKIFDTGDGNQTGLLVYVLASGVKLAAAWGQDPLVANGGAPGLDVGTSIPPIALFGVGKNSALETDNDGDGFISAGDELEYTIVINNVSRTVVSDIILQDNLPSNLTYVPNSTSKGVSQIPDGGSTAFPLDEGGGNIGTIPVGGSFTVTFRALIVNPAPAGSTQIVNTGFAAAVGFTVPFTNTIPLGGIGDFVWNDININGLQDADETGIPGVIVNLYNSAGTILLATATTNGAGHYEFMGLDSASYIVEFIQPAGYSSTLQNQGADDALDSDAHPTTGRTDAFAWAVGQTNTTIDAGFWTPTPSIDIQKTPDTQTVNYGQTATFQIVVTNTGNVALTSISVSDPLAPSCNTNIGSLAVGVSNTYSCSFANVTSGFTNVAIVTGVYNSTPVTDNDSAVVALPPDSTAPTASPTQAPATNGAGWNNSDVTVTWNWADEPNGSGIDAANCTMSSGSLDEGDPLTLNATCRDLAGNTGNASYTLKVDKTGPTITGSRSPAANANSWNNTDVTVSFACSDTLSGLAAGSPPGDTVLSGEGASLSAMGTCYDIAGNSASDTQSGIKIDKTAPNTNLMGPTDWTNTDVTLTLTPYDALSGVSATYFGLDNSPMQSGTSILISDVGIHTIEYWSVDDADNAETHHTAEVKIDKTAPTISHTQSPDANGTGWNNSDVTVTFLCGDNLSGVASCTEPQLVTTEGQAQPVRGTAVDNAGNSATDPATVRIDKTPPTISASADRAPNAYGWYNADVLVSFTCNDSLSGTASCTADQILDQGANQSASGTAIDSADNSNSTTFSGVNIDKTAPSLSGAATSAPNDYGWYNSDVTIHWTCSDTLSGLDGDCPADNLISGEGNTLSASASVSDLAGNNTSKTVNIQIDRANPVINLSATKADNTSYTAGTWTNQNVTVHFDCNDGSSGVATCPADLVYSADGVTPLATGTATDKAGNSASASFGPIQVDKTGPTLNPVVTPNSIPLNGTATVTSGAADALSGLASESCGQLDTSTFGAKSIACTATDNAGNTSSASASYSVVFTFTGFFQPVDNLPTLNSVKAGLGIPIKFSLDGNQGLAIFADGSPASQKISCDSSASLDAIELTVTAGSSSLSYDATTNTYTYVWKTDKAWAGTCRTLTVQLIDGSSHQANFKFTK